MPWTVVAEGNNLGDFRKAKPKVEDLPKGTKLKLRVEMPKWFPAGKLGDLWSAEWWAGKLGPHGVSVTDVRGNWHWMEMYGEVDPPIATLALIAIIVGALAALGAVVTSIYLAVEMPAVAREMPEVGKILGYGAIAVAGAYVVSKLLKRRRT